MILRRLLNLIVLAGLLFGGGTTQLAAQGMGGPPAGQAQQYGPWNRDLELYTSRDGANFEYKGIFVERAGVPHLAQAPDGKIYAVFQWFPLDKPESFDQVAISHSADSGKTWTEPQTISIQGMPSSIFRSFDPTLAILSSGSFRLYFTSEHGGRHLRGSRAIYSAISTDGVHYDFEAGERFGLTDEETYDVTVAYLKGQWHLYCPAPGQGSAYHAVSKDGLRFTRLDNVGVPVQGTWIGNVAVINQTLRVYGSGRQGVWSAVSSDGSEWNVDKAVQLQGGDPAVLKTPQGMIAVVTGGLRNDAFSGPPPFPVPAE